jgi:hypothetical protein
MENAVRDEMRPVKLNLNITPIRPQLSTVTQILAGISEYLASEGGHNTAENKTPYLPNTGPECHHYIRLLFWLVRCDFTVKELQESKTCCLVTFVCMHVHAATVSNIDKM